MLGLTIIGINHYLRLTMINNGFNHGLLGLWHCVLGFFGNTGIILLGYNVNKAIVNHPQIDHKWMVYNHQHMNG